MLNGVFLLFALLLFNTIGIQDFQLTSPHAGYNCIGVIPAGGRMEETLFKATLEGCAN